MLIHSDSFVSQSQSDAEIVSCEDSRAGNLQWQCVLYAEVVRAARWPPLYTLPVFAGREHG